MTGLVSREFSFVQLHYFLTGDTSVMPLKIDLTDNRACGSMIVACNNLNGNAGTIEFSKHGADIFLWRILKCH